MAQGVLILSWEYPPIVAGGLARHVRKLAEGLVRNGVEVRVLTRGARDTPAHEVVQSRLYLTTSTGSSSSEVNRTMTISAYFDDAEQRDGAARELGDIDAIELHSTDRERIDWLDRYQQSLEPLYIGKHFIVAPDASLIPRDTKRHALVVPQEQAFGTGSHETSSLCIEIFETL